MSTYYNYYLTDKDYNPVYPFDADGNLKCLYWYTRSFHKEEMFDNFRILDKSKLPKELQDGYEAWACPLDDLGNTDYMRRGYFLVKDVQAYLASKNPEDDIEYNGLFYITVNPVVYGAMAAQGKVYKPYDDGEEYTAADFMYFAYPDYGSAEYTRYCIYKAASPMVDYGDCKDYQVVCTVG